MKLSTLVTIGAAIPVMPSLVPAVWAQTPPPATPVPAVPDVCAAPGADIATTCNWGTWAIGGQGAALIADLQSIGTYVVCRNFSPSQDLNVDVMTVIDGRPLAVTVGGGDTGLYGKGCQVLRGKKIFLSVKSSGANKRFIKGFYKRIDRDPLTFGYQWSVPNRPAGLPSFVPLLSSERPVLTRLCFASNETIANEQKDFLRSRRLLIGPATYLTYASGAQAQFTPGSCVDLDHKELYLDIDWASENSVSDARGVMLLPSDASSK